MNLKRDEDQEKCLSTRAPHMEQELARRGATTRARWLQTTELLISSSVQVQTVCGGCKTNSIEIFTIGSYTYRYAP
eukprot:9491184-Pyramimonas_sp.AAC.1